jgi:hypothetical protein
MIGGDFNQMNLAVMLRSQLFSSCGGPSNNTAPHIRVQSSGISRQEAEG